MAVKVVRRPKSIALSGAPFSTAASAAGHEAAPAAWRAAGLAARLSAAGFEVTDQGDCAARVFEADDDHPRARNVAKVLAGLEELRPRVETLVKSGALPLILGGDLSIVLAVVAGARRYFRGVSLIEITSVPRLAVPATTTSGFVEAMVTSHVVGRGAPELVRFWGEPPLVREHEVALFGLGELLESERQILQGSSIRNYSAEDIARTGVPAATRAALESTHGGSHEFVLLLDAGADPARTGAGGLTADQLRSALSVFIRQPTLGAIVLSGYNPSADLGQTAAAWIDLLVDALSVRLEPPAPAEPDPAAKNAEDAEPPIALSSEDSSSPAPSTPGPSE